MFDIHLKNKNMKKTILKMLVVTGMITGAVLSSNAQNQKGAILLGGSSNGSITLVPEMIINLGANAHYFLTDKIALGAGVGFTKLADVPAITTISLSGRYYLNSKLYGNVSYGLSELNKGLTLGAGYQLMLSDKVAFLSGLDYYMNPIEGADAQINLNLGISVFIR